MTPLGGALPDTLLLRDLCEWFRRSFSSLPPGSQAYEARACGSDPETLRRAFEARTGTAHELTQVCTKPRFSRFSIWHLADLSAV